MNFGDVSTVPVYVGSGDAFYEDIVARRVAELSPDRIFVVADEYLAGNKRVRLAFFQRFGPTQLVTVPGGEACKTVSTLESVVLGFLESGCTKQSLVVGVGGGSVLNLAGLAAGLTYRGVNLLYFPTTFLAQHDVIPSRKTAINMGGKKNNFGMYYSAAGVLVDTEFVTTLPNLDFFSGVSELVKNMMILAGQSRELVELFVHSFETDPSIRQSTAWIKRLVVSGIKAKQGLLKEDATELNEAIVFEYGHTVGHALEYTCNLPHGIAVLYGMLFCSYVALEMGIMDPSTRDSHDAIILRVLDLAGEGAVPSPFDFGEVRQRATRDNKRGIVPCKQDELTCILLREIGTPYRQDGHLLTIVPADLLTRWMEETFPSPQALSFREADENPDVSRHL